MMNILIQQYDRVSPALDAQDAGSAVLSDRPPFLSIHLLSDEDPTPVLINVLAAFEHQEVKHNRIELRTGAKLRASGETEVLELSENARKYARELSRDTLNLQEDLKGQFSSGASVSLTLEGKRLKLMEVSHEELARKEKKSSNQTLQS